MLAVGSVVHIFINVSCVYTWQSEEVVQLKHFFGGLFQSHE